MTTTIELVSHVYAGVLPQYATLFQYQLSSLVLNPPEHCRVRLTACYCQEDKATVAVIDYFRTFLVQTVEWNWMLLPHDHLMQRAIGRNKAAKANRADVMWFTDCDYWWDVGSLDRLAEIYESGQLPVLAYPEVTFVSGTHEHGDREIKQALGTPPRVLGADRRHYVGRANPRAIGGIQIVTGELARTIGYCDGNRRFLRPAKTFQPMRSDREFRKAVGVGYGMPIDLPGVCRIRHSEIGYECNKKHGQEVST